MIQALKRAIFQPVPKTKNVNIFVSCSAAMEHYLKKKHNSTLILLILLIFIFLTKIMENNIAINENTFIQLLF